MVPRLSGLTSIFNNYSMSPRWIWSDAAPQFLSRLTPLYLVLFLCIQVSFGNWGTKETWKLCNFDPKASEPCLNIDISNVAYLVIFRRRRQRRSHFITWFANPVTIRLWARDSWRGRSFLLRLYTCIRVCKQTIRSPLLCFNPLFSVVELWNYTKTIIRLRLSEYCRIIPSTSSRGLFDKIHLAFYSANNC